MAAGRPARIPPPAGALRLASWNASSGRGPDGRVHPGALAAAAADLRADVLALQEVDRAQPRSGGADQAAEVAGRCAGDGRGWSWRFTATVVGTPGDRRAFGPAGAVPPPGRPAYGIALLTPHPVESWHELRLAPSRASLPLLLPPGASPRVLLVPDEPRAAVAAVVRGPLGRFTAITAHLSFVPWRAVAQLRAVRRWARRLPQPQVLLGDLNLPGPVPGPLTGWRRLVTASTYPAASPRVQLDHVLAAGLPWPVVAATAVPMPVSDHRALLVDLTGTAAAGSTAPAGTDPR